MSHGHSKDLSIDGSNDAEPFTPDELTQFFNMQSGQNTNHPDSSTHHSAFHAAGHAGGNFNVPYSGLNDGSSPGNFSNGTDARLGSYGQLSLLSGGHGMIGD